MAHLLRVIRRSLSEVVGDDVFRFVSGDNNAEQFHLLVFREASHFDQLALLRFNGAPTELVNPLVRLIAATIIH